MISTITAPELERFLAGLSGRSRDMEQNPARLRDVVGLRSKGWLRGENAAKATERAKRIDEPPGILTTRASRRPACRIKGQRLACFPRNWTFRRPSCRGNQAAGLARRGPGRRVHPRQSQDLKNPLPPARARSRQPESMARAGGEAKGSGPRDAADCATATKRPANGPASTTGRIMPCAIPLFPIGWQQPERTADRAGVRPRPGDFVRALSRARPAEGSRALFLDSAGCRRCRQDCRNRGRVEVFRVRRIFFLFSRCRRHVVRHPASA